MEYLTKFNRFVRLAPLFFLRRGTLTYLHVVRAINAMHADFTDGENHKRRDVLVIRQVHMACAACCFSCFCCRTLLCTELVAHGIVFTVVDVRTLQCRVDIVDVYRR